MCTVRFTLPYLPPEAEEAFRLSLSSGHLAADGPFAHKVTDALSQYFGDATTFLTPSGTHALELAMFLLRLEPSDEVIVPSFTFSSTANAVIQAGGIPVFVDIEPETYNISASAVLGAVTDRTRAIVPIHYAGISADMAALEEIGASHNLEIIEDNAHGFGGAFGDRPLGSIGRMSALSFHETKNIQCGEGGAIVLNRRSDIDYARILREKGTNRTQFFLGQVDKYTWVDRGSSWLLAEPLAALLAPQLELQSELQTSREHVWTSYHRELGEWAAGLGIRLPSVPLYAQPAWHIYHLTLPDPFMRIRFIEHLRARGIMAVFHYIPLHSSQAGQRFGISQGDFSTTDYVAERLVRLPIWTRMPEPTLNRIIDAILCFK